MQAELTQLSLWVGIIDELPFLKLSHLLPDSEQLERSPSL